MNRRWTNMMAGLAAVFATSADASTDWVTASFHDYGPALRHSVTLYLPEKAKRAPLLLFVHGGGWSAGSKKMGAGRQPAYFAKSGFAWATMDYRLVPGATVEDQAADVARAIGWLTKRARRFRLDPDRVILIGHSSGAQLAALVATDPQWLKAQGVPFEVVKGVISLDGAGIDVPGIMAQGASGSGFYRNAFGLDPERQTRLSPAAHVGAPDAPRWLLVYDSFHNPPAGRYSAAFAQALNATGASAQVVPIKNTTHMRMLNELGTPGNEATRAVDSFLSEVLGAQR